jgi:glycosyltransferase involved in cell wall biosynthesis
MEVDIVITTYNRAHILPETLWSVAAQTYPHWRCWIAEDGETEKTQEAIRPFLADARFIYAPGEHAGFPAVPRNRAIRQGNAPYIASLDDDDLWLPEKLDRQVDFLKTHPACVLVGCNTFRWNGIDPWEESPLYYKKERLGKIDYRALLRQNYIVHSSAVLRRSALEQAGLYNEALDPPIGEDYEAWLRIAALGNIWVLPEPYVIFRQTPKTYYPKLDRAKNYQAAARVFESALNGTGEMPSPLSHSENAPLAAACRRERDFYLAGPRFLGRFRHELMSTIRTLLRS